MTKPLTKEEAAEQAYPETDEIRFDVELLFDKQDMNNARIFAFKDGWDAKPSDAVEFVKWITTTHHDPNGDEVFYSRQDEESDSAIGIEQLYRIFKMENTCKT